MILPSSSQRVQEAKRIAKKERTLLHCSTRVVGANGMHNIMAADSGEGGGKMCPLDSGKTSSAKYICIYFDNLMDFQL